MYLKSLVAGLNDNQSHLNNKQSILAKHYHEISTKELNSSNWSPYIYVHDIGTFKIRYNNYKIDLT